MLAKKHAVIGFSGGMDSATLLLRLLAEGYNVTALSFFYGQKHQLELERAMALVNYINAVFAVSSISLNIKHRVISINGLQDLLSSTLVVGGDDIPEGHYEQENMKLTVVPNRNKMFASILQAVALSIKNKYNTPVTLALGIHAGDHAIYPDCRQEFRDADLKAFQLGNWDADDITYYTPYLQNNKADILKDGIYCCNKLGLDFDEVYKRTNTSYKPIFILQNPAAHPGAVSFGVGKWYSDYKSASSVERIEAFLKIGRRDPVEYADGTGPVTWEVASKHVREILDK